MCKLIDTDIVREYRVMDKLIYQILCIIDENIKSQYLNEILLSSTKNRTHIGEDRSTDPFDVISASTLAKNEDTGLPNFKEYYAAAFLKWPSPEGRDVKILYETILWIISFMII